MPQNPTLTSALSVFVKYSYIVLYILDKYPIYSILILYFMLLSNILRQRTQSQCSNFSKLQAKELQANFQWYCTYENRSVSNKTLFSIGNLSEEISSQEADI